MKGYNVALLVHTSDRYEFLYQGFEHFFNTYWDTTLPIAYYFATEEISVHVKGFENIKSGKGEWTNRLSRLLSQIEADYIIYIQEDMWLTAPVDAYFFEQLIEQATTKNWQQVKLNSSSVFKTQPTSLFINGFNVAKIDNVESDYLMSHQICLWNKEFLQQQLVPNEHPWRNERRGTKRLRTLDAELFHIDYFSENGQPAINANEPTAKSSAYHTVSHNATLNSNILQFIEVLETQDALKEYAAKLKHNYSRQLTHDGQSRPMKKDIFKLSKEWLRGRIAL